MPFRLASRCCYSTAYRDQLEIVNSCLNSLIYVIEERLHDLEQQSIKPVAEIFLDSQLEHKGKKLLIELAELKKRFAVLEPTLHRSPQVDFVPKIWERRLLRDIHLGVKECEDKWVFTLGEYRRKMRSPIPRVTRWAN
jgi:hypothetical protein